MRATTLTVRDFRSYERAEAPLGERLTVVAGPNGAGKTNLLEAIYFGCTGGSPRTSNDRELIRRGATTTRVTMATEGVEGSHLLEAAFQVGEPKVLRVDGAAVDNLWSSDARPLVSVFLPDRLELVKGRPGSRRAHLDQVVAALWPARRGARAAYSRALAQRNALLARIRGDVASQATLASWDSELARHGAELMAARAQAIELLAPLFTDRAALLGLPNAAQLTYRPRSDSTDAAGLEAELRERREADIQRGFTVHGPHRDDFRLLHGDDTLRSYGSQGQQRVALLALLFAERDLLAEQRGRPPLMLLDDVMSELDATRRELLADLLRKEGQSVLTTTEVEHVPGHDAGGTVILRVSPGSIDVDAGSKP